MAHEVVYDTFGASPRLGLAVTWFGNNATLIGFVGMSFVPTPVFRQLGITLGAGVAFTLLIAIFLVPVLQSLLPQPRAWRG